MVMWAILLPLLCVCLVHGQQGSLGETRLDQRQYQGGARLDQMQYQGEARLDQGQYQGAARLDQRKYQGGARLDQMQNLQYQEARMDLQYPEQEEVEGVNIPGSPGR